MVKHPLKMNIGRMGLFLKTIHNASLFPSIIFHSLEKRHNIIRNAVISSARLVANEKQTSTATDWVMQGDGYKITKGRH